MLQHTEDPKTCDAMLLGSCPVRTCPFSNSLASRNDTRAAAPLPFDGSISTSQCPGNHGLQCHMYKVSIRLIHYIEKLSPATQNNASPQLNLISWLLPPLANLTTFCIQLTQLVIVTKITSTCHLHCPYHVSVEWNLVSSLRAWPRMDRPPLVMQALSRCPIPPPECGDFFNFSNFI